MQVYNNSSIFSVWKNYTGNVANLRGSLTKLSSGEHTVGSDDSSGVSRNDLLRTQYRDSSANAAQVEGEINNLQTADVWLQKIHDITAHMSDLARLAGDTTIDQNSRDDLQKEFAQAQEEIGRISNTLVQQGYNFQPAQAQTDGTTAKEDSANVSLLGFVGDSDMNISSDTQAKNALAQVSAGLEQVASTRTAIGDNIRHLEDTLSNLRNYGENIRAIEANIRDVNIAQEATQSAKYSIQTQVGTAMLAQANAVPNNVISLMQ